MNGVPKDPPKAPTAARSGERPATDTHGPSGAHPSPAHARDRPRAQPSARAEKTKRDQRDLALVRRIRRGDHAAFRGLVRQYQNPIYALCFRMLGSREEAEDVAQEVFLTIHRSVHTWRGESRFYTWLYRVATNHCKNRIKYLSVRNFHRAEDLESTAYSQHLAANPTKGSTSPEQAVAGRRLEAHIVRELANLEPEHRVLIILRDFQGLAYQDIIEITGLPEGTLKSRLHRARVALKRRIHPYLT